MPGEIHPAVARLVLEGLARASPARVNQAAVDRLLAGDGGVSLDGYRAVIDPIVEAGLGAALIDAGAAVAQIDHPFLYVLLNSDTPRQVLDKELRLARFIHSRHELRIVEEAPDALVVDHISAVEERPNASESLAACGQHLALFAEIGCVGLTCRFPYVAEGPTVYAGQACPPLPALGDFSRWSLGWETLAPTRRPMPGLDELLLSTVESSALRERPSVVTEVERVVRTDLARSWKLEDVATALDTSARSLQRALSRAGTSWSRELDRVRVEEAARLLDRSELSVTEIGYVCGFADGAHFGRRFKKRHGRTPSAHREARKAAR